MTAASGTPAREIAARETLTSTTPVVRRPKPPQLQRRTRVVAAMRLILPAIAAILLAALGLWSRFGFDSNSFRLAMGSLGLASIDTLSMSNPHFEGLDDKERPFSLTATRATQVDSTADVIDLNAPQADITLEDGAWLTLTSDSGRYQRDAQLLYLQGQVNLFHDKGYELHTRDVHIDLAKGSAVSSEAVDGQGPSGDLTAQGMEVVDSGKRIRFLGRAHMTFYDEGQMSAAVPKP
jgi:lipopolysaccharide export system protein LptC